MQAVGKHRPVLDTDHTIHKLNNLIIRDLINLITEVLWVNYYYRPFLGISNMFQPPLWPYQRV